MTRRVALALAGLWLLIASAAFVGTYLANAASAAQSPRQGDAALGGTGATVAPRLLGERLAADDAASVHGSFATQVLSSGIQMEQSAHLSKTRTVPPTGMRLISPLGRWWPRGLQSSRDVFSFAYSASAHLACLIWSPMLRFPALSVTHLSSLSAASRPSPNGNPAEPPRQQYDGGVTLPSPETQARSGAPTPPNVDLPSGRPGVGGGAPFLPALLSAGLAGPAPSVVANPRPTPSHAPGKAPAVSWGASMAGPTAKACFDNGCPVGSQSKPPRSDALTGRTVRGIASHYAASFGPRWLALPEGPGVRVRVTGPGGSVVRTSNDAGPALFRQRQGRVVDLSWADFRTICGCTVDIGLVDVTVEYLP